jgi:predicted amidophosphoribosyltransferase
MAFLVALTCAGEFVIAEQKLKLNILLRVEFLTLYSLTLNLLTTIIVAPPSNASKWQMGFNSAFKGLNNSCTS